MCSIIGSRSNDILRELIKLNSHRGNFSYSMSRVVDNKVQSQIKGFGPFDTSKIEDTTDYRVCHIQAPTGGLIKDIDRIHPTKIDNSYLFHNGILTHKGMDILNQKNNSNITFDTLLLHTLVNKYGFDILSEVDGLFTCLYIDNDDIFVFRTKHGKLYIDKDINISSERFGNAKCINYDTVYKLNIVNKTINEVHTFKTLSYNFVVRNEM